jgi:hypothetical protein
MVFEGQLFTADLTVLESTGIDVILHYKKLFNL